MRKRNAITRLIKGTKGVGGKRRKEARTYLKEVGDTATECEMKMQMEKTGMKGTTNTKDYNEYKGISDRSRPTDSFETDLLLLRETEKRKISRV